MNPTGLRLLRRKKGVTPQNVEMSDYQNNPNVRYRTGKRTKVHFDLVTYSL